MDGKPIRRVLEWLLNRDLTDADMAAALDVHPSNYSRHKDDDDYPSFEELTTLGGILSDRPVSRCHQLPTVSVGRMAISSFTAWSAGCKHSRLTSRLIRPAWRGGG
jgi:hypothetical protein